MFACRAAWQRCGPLARQSLYRAHLYRDVVPRRLMSSVPGGSGENLLYVVLCGGVFAGALTYTYRTIGKDRDRVNERLTEIKARPKAEWKPKPWPPKSSTRDDGDEANGIVAEEDVNAVASEIEAEPEVLMEVAQAKDAGSLETVVEKVAEMVAETAEVVAEVAEVVAETAEEVAAVAQEVEKLAQEVETAAEAVVAPVIQAEEPSSESNVVKSESVSLETLEMAAASVLEVPVKSVSVEDVDAGTETTVQTEAAPERPINVPPAEELESEPVIEAASVASPVFAEEAPFAEEVSVPAVIEDVPAEESVNADSPVTSEEAPVTPVAEEAPVDSPVTPVVEEAPVDSPVAEEAPVDSAVTPVAEEAPVTPVAEEAPVDSPVNPVAEEAPVDSPVTDDEAPVEDVQESPAVEDVTAESPVVEVLESVVEEAPASPVVEITDVNALENPAESKDFIVVVLEGAPKSEKKPKVLGVSPLTGKIIPAPDDDVEPSGQVTGQAPIA
nr:fibrous sheath CABYR-binding protein isoform X2 [Misgurnus anguillicaudatus]